MKSINVVSLFDGMSCGQIALERAGIKVDNYFASEIDKYGQIVSKANYPNTIYLGDVRNINGKDLPKIDLIIGGSPCQSFSFAGKRKGMSTKDEQEILTLQHYLQLKSEGFEFEGQSYLFWEYMRLLNECNPKYFLLENVEMGEKWEKVLSKAIEVNGIHINSALVSAQNRKRIYWTNIGMKPSGLFGDLQSIIEQPKDKGILLKDILEIEVDQKYYLSEKLLNHFNNKSSYSNFKFDFKPTDGEKKGACLTASMGKMPITQGYIVHNMMPQSGNPLKGGTGHLTRNDGKTYCLDTGNTNAVEILGCDYRNDEGFRFRENGKSGTLMARAREDIYGTGLVKTQLNIRRLTPLECERLQTVPDNYTNHVSDSQRYKMLGNGWTVDVISHIFSYIEP
jgi:DNA (cytosine-5)-methyltransferase 3A